jgi:hypothetical protein
MTGHANVGPLIGDKSYYRRPTRRHRVVWGLAHPLVMGNIIVGPPIGDE